MQDPDFAAEFTGAMDSRGACLAHALAAQLDCTGYHSLLDIAGGSGIYACTLVEATTQLAATVLELSPVDQAARQSIAAKGMSQRVGVMAGDMFQELPSGFDIHLFANTLHDWDEAAVRRLIELSHAALNEGGMIVIFDAHLNAAKDGPLALVEYSCLLMHSTVGRCYAAVEIQAMLSQAGFVDLRAQAIAAGRSALTGRKERHHTA